MYITTFLRLYLLYILFNIAGWVYFGYLMYYTINMTEQTCNNYTNELCQAIKIFVGLCYNSLISKEAQYAKHIYQQQKKFFLLVRILYNNYKIVFSISF